MVLNSGVNSQKFLFKDGQIFKEDLSSPCDKNEFLEAIKKLLDHFLNKILEHESELENYEQIYTGSAKVANFAKRHHVFRYEIRKFESRISRIYEALQICAAEQNELKKELKNSVHKCGVLKSMIEEYSLRVEDIYSFIQSDKNDKINKNIYLLTLLSALFLPLNFITGFFGMNTNGMFLSSFKDGTAIVFAFTALLCVLFFVLFYRSNKSMK
ncbi:CorA family divalent cation transporter [uncultured Campylobacter sp.]|uniref:CorA family divalent cation transporter n=1 Tax=uncultured Campylobacter sp. TaxID=218934 RepID=UPI002609382E|nr:CorA family divalent cation transporter [uncultured Campylobacter sp.]